MANSKKLVSLIREIVRQEVQKEVKQIFIKEGMKSMAEKSTLVEDTVMEVLPERKPKPKKKVTYTNNPVLNDILNETANQPQEMEEYPTMGGGTFDSTKMAQAMGYGNMVGGDKKVQREIAAVQTAQAAGADTSNPAVQDVMKDLTKDYSAVMKALKKKDGKI
jgi:hypothetical protein|tara:strand:- start:4502 stop:4990 length:489 start_codon:yes stop_codon:yes gene_type:complete